MVPSQTSRKLRAILSADVVGYSLLMADNELATIATLKSHKETIATVIQEHNGRVVDSPGDNLLAEFASALDAVKSAIVIQETLQTKNAELPNDLQMRFRIGINIGDVIHEGDHIYGDGVNVAARIESLADPGGVCISRSVFDHVKQKLDLGFEYLGEQSVKNISEPVRVYRILTDPTAAGKVIGEKKFLGKVSRRMAIAAIVTLAIVAGGLISYYIYLHQAGRIEPASLDKMAYPLPDNPSIAVLPFDNLSGDPEQEYFSDGITEEIITSLSKLQDLLVIARNSTFSYKGTPVKVQQVAEELGVRYVLEGSVRKNENEIRITAQLIDAIKGHHLWAERYDRELKDIFFIQDEITKKIITELQVSLTEGEQAYSYAEEHTDLDIYLKRMQSKYYINLFSEEGNLSARKILEEIVEKDPKNTSAYTALGWTHWMDVMIGVSESPRESIVKAAELARKALAMGGADARTHGLMSYIYTIMRKHDQAIEEAEKTIFFGPGVADAYGHASLAYVYGGQPETAIRLIEKGMRLDPIPPNYYYVHLGIAYRCLGRYEDSLEAFKKLSIRSPNSLIAHLGMAAAYSLLEKDEEARLHVEELMKINPNFSLARQINNWPYKREVDRELLYNALRKAGLK